MRRRTGPNEEREWKGNGKYQRPTSTHLAFIFALTTTHNIRDHFYYKISVIDEIKYKTETSRQEILRNTLELVSAIQLEEYVTHLSKLFLAEISP